MSEHFHVLNEYSHVNSSCFHPESGYCQVYYEALDNSPIVEGSLSGIIYSSDQSLLVSFSCRRGDVVDIEHESSSIKLFGGRLRRDDGEMKLIFREDMGEHYLCVSYMVPVMFSPKGKELKLRHNWSLEGF